MTVTLIGIKSIKADSLVKSRNDVLSQRIEVLLDVLNAQAPFL